MKRSSLSLILAMLAASALAVAAAGCTSQPNVEVNNVPESTGIQVSGRGEVVVEPDTGRLIVGVEVTRDTVAEAREEAAATAGALIDSAKANGVEDRDLRTAGLSIQPLYQFTRNGERVLIGYVVTNTVSITVRDLERFSAVIDDAVEAGGDSARLQSIGFELEEREEAVAEAREAAMKDARSRAEQLAEAAGVELGAAVSISEVSSSPPPPIVFDAPAGDRGGAETPIEPGTMSVVVDVQVRWSIE